MSDIPDEEEQKTNNPEEPIPEHEETNPNETFQDDQNKKILSEKEIYEMLLTHMKNIQSKASKKLKKKTYALLLTFVNDNPLNQECLDLLIKGDRHQKIEGICQLTSKKTRTGDFKGSTIEFLKMIHDWMYLSGVSDKITTEFAINDDYVARMNLGQHYSDLINSSKKEKKQLAQTVIEIIHAIITKRPSLELSEFIRTGFIDMVKEGLEKLEKDKKKEEEKQKEEIDYAVDVVNEAIKTVSMEPKTWEEVEKLNKKLLTCEFLTTGQEKQFVDEEKEAEIDLIDNFIDPLNNDAHLNINSYDEEDVKKMHVQMETFDPVFFLEKLHKTISLDEFSQSLNTIDESIKNPEKQETLIDKNIYKYLDCKKLLDNILQKFNSETNSLMTQFNAEASSLQFAINDKMKDVKQSFDLIIKSKNAKEIILKFSKYFLMKDTIEHHLKFSGIDELADYLKKINTEIKDISQKRIIYNEFYLYFSRSIENFKNVLVDLIKNSPVNDKVLKYFKNLIDFDVEVEVIDSLVNDQKVKMCDKIKNYLESSENFEIKNFKKFFCDEDFINEIGDDEFGKFLQISEKSLNENRESVEQEKKKELINVENIIKGILYDINDFLFTMKVLDESLDLKTNYLQRGVRFSTVATEIYFVLFEELKVFLFDTNFSMEQIINDNYNQIYQLPENQYMKKIIAFYTENPEIKNILFNESFNKNTLQNLSNLIIEIFEKFEYHLSSEILDSLNENKSVIIEKIFIAFLNEKIKSTITYFMNENTITFTETEMSVFNYSSFSFTKEFFKILCKNYINVLKFYMNIVTKVQNIRLPYEIIYQSFFMIVKFFILRFYVFYNTEKKYSKEGEDIKLNCLIVETLRNFNYIQYEIKSILKSLFKNKEKDYEEYLDDLEKYLSIIRKIFLNEYVTNASENLVAIFVSSNSSNDKGKFNFYEKYNEILISNNNKDIFVDSRSVLIDLIANVANCLRDMDIINKESPTEMSQEEINETNSELITQVIEMFYDKFIAYSAKENELLCKDKKEVNPFKYISQLYLEFNAFNSILSKYSSKLKRKIEMVKEILFSLLNKTKGTNGKQSENAIFDKAQLSRQNEIIERYKKNYSVLYKCFIEK